MKPFYLSRTLWFNVLTLAVMAGSGQLGIPIPPNVAIPVVTIANIALRLITNQPIGQP